MKIYGKVYKVYKKDRLFSMIVNKRLMYFHMTNKNMRDFKAYLFQRPYVFLKAAEEKANINGIMCYEIVYFYKIYVPKQRNTQVYFDLGDIRKDIKKLLNKETHRLFLDLEFSLPTSFKKHMPEILQYGMILEDSQGNVIFEDSSLIRPQRKSSLSSRTLKFLSLDYVDFNDAPSYIHFYQLLERMIKAYDTKIIAWGKNDILILEQSFKMNHLQPLDIRNRYINLMQVIKNYYHHRQEMGLFHTHNQLSDKERHLQVHNAFEDAYIARKIFHLFREKIN